MGIARGPNIIKDGLVFGYDTGYGVADNDTTTRFYPGALTTNIVPLDLSNSSWFNEYSGGRTLRSETLFGQPSYEFKSNDGQIWISPFAFNSYDRSSNDLTLSVYAKNIGSSAVSMNTFFGGDYSSDSLGNSNTKSLPADNTWRRYSWTRFSSAMSNNYLEFRTANTDVVISCPQLQIGRVVTPIVDGSRSSTESLIDLKRTTDINVSNISFDSTGQPEFDGTDDIINTGMFTSRNPTYEPLTIEAIVKSDTTSNAKMWLDATSNGTNQRLYCALPYAGSSSPMGVQASAWSISTPQNTDFHHIVITMNGTTCQLYLDGVAHSSKAYTSYGLQSINIGGRNGYRWIGKIPVVKMHNKALTASEIKNNFNAYKNRFNI
jgi:hypothetical protein